jgi:hypothetical protein
MNHAFRKPISEMYVRPSVSDLYYSGQTESTSLRRTVDHILPFRVAMFVM